MYPPPPADFAGYVGRRLPLPPLAIFCRPDGSDLRVLELAAEPPPKPFAELAAELSAAACDSPEETAARLVRQRRRGRRARPTLRELVVAARLPLTGLPLPPPFPPAATAYVLQKASTPSAFATASAAAW